MHTVFPYTVALPALTAVFTSMISIAEHHFMSFRSKFPYQAITPIPSNAAKILNVKATIPLAVNPSGNGAGGSFWP